MRYFIITFGCQMNKSDSERISAFLEKKGYNPASKEDGADLIVVNMCSVRQSAVDRVFGLSQKLAKLKFQNSNLKTILTGCILKEDRKKFRNRFDLILNIKDLPKGTQKLSTINNQQLTINNYLKIQPKYSNNFSAYIPISNGCNNACTYCVVPFTRGPLVCRDHMEILKEVKNMAKKGMNEIWLLGQNVNDYHSPADSKINFAKLLKKIDDVPGDFKILFTSPHPQNFSDELISTLADCKKFGEYISLPAQSGDNEILKKMNRNYTIKKYKNLVKKLREAIPRVALSTDVIVGFPGETKKQFQNTAKLFKKIKFDWAYIAKYSPRSGTAAFKLKDNVPLVEKKKREKILREILKNRVKS